jgi:hypothetical protein
VLRTRHSLVAGVTAVLLIPCSWLSARAQPVPHLQRVVLVVMENKNYDQVRVQPYTASLIAAGATMTNALAVTHPSQPNYFAIWAASTLGVTNNNCPATATLFPSQNLGHACEAAGLTWRAYVENLPAVGSTDCSADGDASSGLYTRKHAPWTYFSNLDHTNERPYGDLAADIAGGTLPSFAVIIPNNCHNSHNDATPGCSVADADAWMAANLPTVLAALGPDGVLILTWDEDDNTASNHILTVIVGPRVVPGSVVTSTTNHYRVTRTICELLGLPVFANGFGETAITGIWATPTPATTASWGRLKVLYR